MAAPHIPNLLSLRGKPRTRGMTKRHGSPIDEAKSFQKKNELVIQGTDNDAAVSRLSAVTLGYLKDPYASIFVKGPISRRLPIINRGTYGRTFALDTLISFFLSSNQSPCEKQTKQIISLGAGTDTRYFRLRDSNKDTKVIYHEFDFPAVSAAKRQIVLAHLEKLRDPKLEDFWSTQSVEDKTKPMEWGFVRQGGDSEEISYCFHPFDLRDFAGPNPPNSFVGLRTDLPTLILSECCLCYMNITESKSVVKWFTNKIPSIGIILYEPIGADDSFGQMMISNLAARNITMPSLAHYKSLSDQRKRLLELGFNNPDPRNGCEAQDIENIWEKWVTPFEKQRVDGLEGLDEVEEWQMLARHYAIVWAWRSVADEWQNWRRSENLK
ncbi:Leucine carboxyl methyltransferase 1 [Golovinomyces cichoracearum]|uniref:Leucine carboxyl methyltransferase 1 n=1 Tax=Golovinomyces cichoracearum TaxID=62708 RepID=A0A420IWU1_9PEZI|nr:Leucine carboxyl methyltransferase 1 [Golovinomyces cichoracearum]